MVPTIPRLVPALALALVLGAVTAAAAERRSAPAGLASHTVETSQGERSFLLFVPGAAAGEGERADDGEAAGATAEPVPLLVLLHGAGRDPQSILGPWPEIARREGLVLLAPRSTGRGGWAVPEDGPQALHEVIERVRREAPVDPRRIYLFGHSAGGEFALQLILTESEYYAAAAAHGAAFPNQGESSPFLPFARREAPVGLWVGEGDRVFPPEAVTATGATLEEEGFAVHLEVIPHHTHDLYGRYDEIAGKAWEFLAGHALGGSPRHRRYAF